MKEAFGGRHPHQGCHLRSATRLPINHDGGGVAAEVRDVFLNPTQGCHEVRHANVDGVFVSCTTHHRDVKEAQYIEAVIDRDLNDIMMASHLSPFVRRELIGRAKTETTAV